MISCSENGLVHRFVAISWVLLCACLASAQVDSTSVLLLDQNVSQRRLQMQKNDASKLESSRYTIKKSSKKSEDPGKKTKANDSEDSVAHEVPAAPQPPIVLPNSEAPINIIPTVSGRPVPPPPPQATPEEERNLAALAKEPQVRAEIPFDERRLNLLELALIPQFMYLQSSSDYSYRNYSINSPGAELDMSMWLSYNWGIELSFLTSLGASVSDRPQGDRNVSVTQSELQGGVRYRKYFGATRLAPSLIFQFNYFETSTRVPQTSVSRAKLTSSGLKIGVEAEMPVAAQRAWLMGFSIAPKLNHKEDIAATDFSSGSGSESNQIGFELGLKLNMDRGNAFLIKLAHQIEKNQFSGTATRADQNTGYTPSSVGVLQSLTTFGFGYQWGD